jgi:hypothetical protein
VIVAGVIILRRASTWKSPDIEVSPALDRSE